jgi:hypothetical protein
MDKSAVFVVSDERFFLGLVGLVNSLRLQGYRGEVVVLDCGLTAGQRSLLYHECEFVPCLWRGASTPALYKAFGAWRESRGVVVVADSDVVVTGGLEEMLEWAAEGWVCAARDPEEDRWFPEWTELFGLKAPLRRGVYVNSGFVAFSVDRWPALLRRWWEACERIWSHPWLYAPGVGDGPSAQADQDALNAVLMSEIPAGALRLLPAEAVPIGDASGLQVDRGGEYLVSTGLGQGVWILQGNGATKPWEAGGWRRLAGRGYEVALRAVLAHPRAPVRLPPRMVPWWLRDNPAGRSSFVTLARLNRSRLRHLVGRLVRAGRSLCRGKRSLATVTAAVSMEWARNVSAMGG